MQAPAQKLPFQKLTVIGLGLIGGSLMMAAKDVYPDLWTQAVDPNAEALEFAVKNRLVERVSRTLPEFFEEGTSEQQHLVVLACHLSQALKILPELAPLVKDKNITVTDVGSCKRAMVELGETLLPDQFIGGHPMAGKEFSGVSHATPLLFSRKSYIFCPPGGLESNQALKERFETLRNFVQGFGGVPRVLDAETHDRYMAYVSHLPQLYSLILTNFLYRHEPGHLLSYHGGGIDDQLRLAASPYQMWGDVFAQNQDNIRGVLEELTAVFQEANTQLDRPELAEWFARSNRIHQEFHQIRHQ